ncbi:MAG: hypothetical protein JNK82_42790 [Myxococcaceae bacterium]|nr:hypothetical protein [Myxococcaceae bacterium]
MSADVAIDDWLKGLGYGSSEARSTARVTLEAAGLTRQGKQRLSNEKLARARAVLSEQLYLHCQSAECVQAAAHSGKLSVLCEPKPSCQSCGGSDNQRAAHDFVAAFGRRRLCIVGGSPSVWEELERLFGAQLELRLVDGTQRRTVDHAKADLEWADLVLLWGASELHHKVSMQYTNAGPAQKKKVLHVTRRGIAQLLAAGLEYLRRHSA